jgi:hypothetical protein
MWVNCRLGIPSSAAPMFPEDGGTLANLFQATRRHIPEGGHLCGHRLPLEIFLFIT